MPNAKILFWHCWQSQYNQKGTKSLCSYVCNVIRIPSFILIPISRCFCDLKLCAAHVATKNTAYFGIISTKGELKCIKQ